MYSVEFSPRLFACAGSYESRAQDSLGVGHDGELAVEDGQRHGVDLFGAVASAVGAGNVKRGCGVGDDGGVEAEVARHTCGGGDAVRRGEANDHKRFVAVGAQRLLQFRADEGAVDVLLEERLAGERPHLVLDLAAGKFGAQGRGDAQGEVLHVVDRAAALAPRSQEAGHVLFGARIVTLPETRIVHALLYVDDQEDRRLREGIKIRHGVSWRRMIGEA